MSNAEDPDEFAEFTARVFGEPASPEELEELENIASTFLDKVPSVAEQHCGFAASQGADGLPQGYLSLKSEHHEEHPDAPCTTAMLLLGDATPVVAIELNEAGSPSGYSLVRGVDTDYAAFLLLDIASANDDSDVSAITTVLRTVIERLIANEITPEVATQVQDVSRRLLVGSSISTLVRASGSPIAVRRKVDLPFFDTAQLTIERYSFTFTPDFTEEDFDLTDTPELTICYQDRANSRTYYYTRYRDGVQQLEVHDDTLTKEEDLEVQAEHEEDVRKSGMHQPTRDDVGTFTNFLLRCAAPEDTVFEDALREILED